MEGTNHANGNVCSEQVIPPEGLSPGILIFIMDVSWAIFVIRIEADYLADILPNFLIKHE